MVRFPRCWQRQAVGRLRGGLQQFRASNKLRAALRAGLRLLERVERLEGNMLFCVVEKE
jgi:hypothetical protein